MNVRDFIERNGETVIPNPLYNSKSKKNKQPATIPSLDVTGRVDPLSELAAYDALHSWSATKKETEKYNREGYTYNPRDIANLDKGLVESQSALTKFGNALAQAVVSELALGTVKGASDLVDLVGNAFRSNGDYSNPVSQQLEQWQEQFREYAPIYSNPTKNIFNGGLTNAGWWASNLPSVISSLTLLIPSTGIVKGASYLGKILNIGAATRKGIRTVTGVNKKLQTARNMRAAGATSQAIQDASKLTKTQRFLNSTNTARGVSLFLENGTTAALSRAMENYQEARQTYNDMYIEASDALSNMSDEEYNNFLANNREDLKKAGVNTDNRDEVAKHIATKAADRTFAMDWTNVAFDVIQMYALRNAWKGIKNADGTPASVRRAQKDAMMFSSETEAKAAKAKWSFGKRAAEKVEDFLYGSKLIVAGELSEGVEEAVNTIASKEGIHYGKTLLGKEDRTVSDDTNGLIAIFTGLDGRLKSYLQNPELWDAAFWGVMGGVIFQAGGSKLRQISNKITGKSDATEDAKKERAWYALDELPENKRRIAEIWDRRVQFADYKSKLDQINDGKNIFDLDEEGKPRNFASEAEQQIARDKLMKTYITKMTLRAAHSGNLDMFKEFLADEAVRASFVDQGFFDDKNKTKTKEEKDAESRAYIQKILNQVEKVEKEYEDELIAVTDAAALIKHNNTPMEYLEIIASENIYNRQAIEDFDNQKIAIEDRIGQLEIMFADKLDKNIDYRSQIKLQVLTNELGHLRAQRKRFASGKENSLSNQLAIENIDKKIEEIESQLDDAELTYATFQSLRYYTDADGKVQSGNNQEADNNAFIYMDRMITRNIEESNLEGLEESLEDLTKLGLSKRSRTYLSQSDKGRFNVMLSDTSAVNNLRNISPELNQSYRDSVALDIKKAWTDAEIYRTVDEVENRVGEIHNSLDVARKKAINDANMTLQKLYKKYGDNIRAILRNELNGTSNKSENINQLTSAEQEDLKDAFKILALQKSYNKNLATYIEDLFDAQDDIAASNEEKESQSSSTSQDAISDTETSNLDISSQQPINTENGQETEQIEGTEEQIDPQNIQNRQPTFYANWYKDESGKHRKENDNSQTAIYDNGDGTFTVVPQNEKDLHNSKLFGNIDEVDLLSPYKVDTYPIARRNKRGKLEIVQKGELTNNVDEITPTTDNTTQEDNIVDESGNANPSTGEVVNLNAQQSIETGSITEEVVVEENPITTIPTVENINPVIEQSNAEDDIRLKSLSKFISEYKANHDIDLDELAKQLIEEEVKNGADRTIATDAINKSKAVIQRKIARKTQASSETMQSSVDEVLVAQSSLIEENVQNDAIVAYTKAVDTMLNQYAKEVNLNRIGGKLYINLEDLLRYVNTITFDNKMANMIYSSIKQYLSTEEAQKDFITIDDENISKEKFFENIGKSQEQRRQERLADNSVHRVQIDNLEDYTAFDELQQGDKLTVSHKNNKLSLLDNKGREVGILPYPSIDSSTGAYKMNNDGWIYDILTGNNGTITSKLCNIFVKWLTSDDKFSKEINEIVYELAYTKTSDARKQEFLDKFNVNPEIKKAKADGFIANGASSKKLINGLVKLWRFENRLRTASIEDQNDVIAESVNKWFEKLRNSYDNVASLASGNKDTEIVVDEVSDGELIRIVENDKIEAENQALPINKAIAGKVDPNVHKIAITSRQSGMLEISGNESLYLPSESAGVTMVVIPNRNGKPGFVQAFPAIVTHDYVGNDIKEIMSTIKEEAIKLIKEHADNPSSKTYNDLKEFFRSIFANDRGNNGYSSLFNGVIFSDKGNGFTLTSNYNTRNFIAIYERSAKNTGFSTVANVGNSEFEKNERGYQTKAFTFKDDELIKHLEKLINNASIKFNFNYIDSDGYTNYNLKGIANKENGEFIIRVGDKTWKYKTFNEFVLNNNLARLNTKPNEEGTSNYSRKGIRSQRANQTLNIRIVSKTTSPVENIPTQEVTQPIRGKSINEQVIDILKSNSNTKGLDIVRAIIGTNPSFTENTLNMFETLDILPKSIIFDENFNKQEGYEDINAEYNRSTGKIIIGQKWLDMFNNPTTRSEAIRKLIHEKLHAKLTKNRGYIRSAKEIYDEYKKFIEVNKFDSNHPTRKYLFENYNEDKALEEFLVESLTSNELANYLNQIDADVTKKRGARNLFQKILELMAKVFNWNVREGSLYEKELHTLRNIFDNETENKDNITAETETSEEIKTDELVKQEQETEIDEKELSDSTSDDVIDVLDDNLFSSITETNMDLEKDYTPEMQDIKSKAITGGTFMKAPNGNSTNLTERQWLQVRTANFINWFGDWINNPSEASKVIDENGEPLVVYHGSPNTWNVFNPDKIGSITDDGYYGRGLYLSSIRNKAEEYGNIKELFVNIRKPIRTGIDKHITMQEANKNIIIAENFNRDGNSLEYDGVLYSGGDGMYEEIVVPTSNQIKSAISNNGEFSTENDDIRYSSISESTPVIIASNVPNIQSFSQRLPLSEQPDFDSLVASAAFMTSCR